MPKLMKMVVQYDSGAELTIKKTKCRHWSLYIGGFGTQRVRKAVARRLIKDAAVKILHEGEA